MTVKQLPLLQVRGPMGVPIQVSPGLFMVMPVLLLLGGGGDIGFQVKIIVVLLLSVILHELGHAFAAILQGIRVSRIVLNFSGGFCEFHADPNGRAYVLTLLGGPLVNLALCALSVLIIVLSSDPMAAKFLIVVAAINLGLGLLNLVPVFPTDGGRVLMAFLLNHRPEQACLRLMGAVGLAAILLWIGIFVTLVVNGAPLSWLLIGALALTLLPVQLRLLRQEDPFDG